MKTESASAYSLNQDSFKSGKEMSEKALSKISNKNCDFAFVFASSEHYIPELFKGIRAVLGDQIQILGGTSSGIITNDFIGYEGIVAGILIIASSDVNFQTDMFEGLGESEYDTGKRAGKKLGERLKKENSSLLLFYDSIPNNPKDYLSFLRAVPMLSGIESEIVNWPPVAGVGLVNMARSAKTKVWCINQIQDESLLTIAISGNIQMDTTIMHGLKPASDYHTITKTNDNIVLELDHKPATELVKEYMGNPEDIDWKTAMYFITLGVNMGEKYGPFIPENYVNRMVLAVDEKTGGLIMIEGDLKEGDNCQFMRRCIETDMVKKGADDLLNSLSGRKPVFAFYISCLGRIKKIFGTEKEEAQEIQEALGNDVPLLGIYSGVEIAKVNNKIMPLDWTGVLCVFSIPE